MRHLDLFSGIGGFALAARWAGIETVAFCEIEEFPRKVLQKNFPGVPIHRDIHDLDGSEYAGIDLITGGYPCQPFSLAGKRKGTEDDRHLWPEMRRIIAQAKPSWVVCENVAGHVTMGLDEVLSDLESEGYATQPLIIPACAKDAPHRRDRVWIIGYSNVANSGSKRRRGRSDENAQGQVGSLQTEGSSTGTKQRILADTDSLRVEGARAKQQTARAIRKSEAISDTNSTGFEEQRKSKLQTKEHEATECGSRWEAEPNVGRVANGIPNRVDRLKGLGNAIVPQVAYEILRTIRAV